MRPQTLHVSDALPFLLGTWQLRRSIEDHRAAISGSFVGEATLFGTSAISTPAELQRARYHEVGELQFGACRGPARRTLEYVRLDDASVLLCFANGRPYIDLDLSTGACDRIHDCGEDRYEIHVVVKSRDLVEERWVVQGPQKDYEALATLTRC